MDRDQSTKSCKVYEIKSNVLKNQILSQIEKLLVRAKVFVSRDTVYGNVLSHDQNFTWEKLKPPCAEQFKTIFPMC